MTAKTLAFSTATEGATGVALLAVPSLVGELLLGAELPGVGSVVARCFGIALVALAVACWPGDRDPGLLTHAFRGMAFYNAMIAMFLAYVAVVDGLSGPLLWPAVAIHAVVAVLLVRPQSTAPSAP